MSPQWDSLAIAFGLISTPPSTPLWIFKNLWVCGDCHTPTKFIGKLVGRTIVTRDATHIHYFENGLCSCRGYRWCPASQVLFSVKGCVLKYYAEAIYREKMNDNHGVRRKRGCILERRRVQGCHVEAWHDLFPVLNAVPICEVPAHLQILHSQQHWNDAYDVKWLAGVECFLLWVGRCCNYMPPAAPSACRIILLPTFVLCTWMHILQGPSSQPFSTCHAASKNEVESIHQHQLYRNKGYDLLCLRNHRFAIPLHVWSVYYAHALPLGLPLCFWFCWSCGVWRECKLASIPKPLFVAEMFCSLPTMFKFAGLWLWDYGGQLGVGEESSFTYYELNACITIQEWAFHGWSVSMFF